MRRLRRLTAQGRLIAYYWHLWQHHTRALTYWTHIEREAQANGYRFRAQNAGRRCVWSLERIETAQTMLDRLYPRWVCHVQEREERAGL